jgi:hypothetical protein
MMMNMNTSPPRKAQSKGDKTLRDLSKRGLVMKSPFFTMFSDNSKNNDNNDSSNQSTNDKVSSCVCAGLGIFFANPRRLFYLFRSHLYRNLIDRASWLKKE